MRKLYCSDCGKFKPTHPQDAALGLIPRRVIGKAIKEFLCDGCDCTVSVGVAAVAESIPKDMLEWEYDYLTP